MTASGVESSPAGEPEPAGTPSVGQKAKRGLRWSLIGNALTKAANFGLGIVLARLLTPEDFGIYAVALSAMYLLMMVKDVGLIAATQQWRGELEEMAPTATTIAFGFSVFLYGGFFLAAPWISAAAGVPEATNVLRVLTVIILIEGVTAVRSGALLRNFRQDRLMLANLIGLGVNATVAITLATRDAGAYSFAGGQLAGALVVGVLVFTAARLPFRFGMEPAIARRLLWYGVPLMLSLGVEAVLLNIDKIIIGRLTDSEQLGFYLLAFNVSTWAVSVISMSIRYVSIAGFSRLSEQDSETLSTGVRKSAPLLFMVAVPIAVVTAVLAEPLVTVVYGERWAAAAAALRFLAILTLVRMIAAFAMDILMAAGATRSTLWVHVGWAVALIPAIYLGTNQDGIRGGAIAHAVVGVVVAVPLVLVALHRVGVRLAPIAPTLVRPLLGGVVTTGVTLLVSQLTAGQMVVQLLVSGIAGLITYAVIAVPRDQRQQVLTIIRGSRSDATQ